MKAHHLGVGLALLTAGTLALAQAPAAKPTIPQVCTNCHQAKPGNVQGYFENVAFKSKSIQLKIDAATEIVRFDEATLKVVTTEKTGKADMLRDIPKGREARIEYAEKDGVKTATLISFKGVAKMPPEKELKYEQVLALVEQGKASNTVLIDSRPLPRFQEGTIPGAINLPYPAWDKFVDRLPKDKNQAILFFCQGPTCMMSPNSLRNAEKLGYTNVKVYPGGVPEWLEKNVGVLSPAFLQEAWIAKDIPHVLIDVRPASTVARDGFIPGAVNVPVSQIPAALATLPPAKLRAPIMVYDGDGGTAARYSAKTIQGAGQTNVNTVTGGFDAWKAAGNKVATGTPVTKIAYAPKPRPGEISIAEFTALAKATPADVLILDVRNQDEANAGMIKGAKLIPDEDLAARMGEIPKDKRILTHCATGVRAEMAYHKLKDKGYKVNFVKADLAIKKDGSFVATPPK
ncbi:MAG TPA: rhodanese-like domain-containing protein [Casimicrobiaceae bacterium]|nr:rhodanese-like domain-containing protein [Casimicrobiaceae bacterium]